MMEDNIWIKAPDWANFLAKDYDGTWYWYSEKPEYIRCILSGDGYYWRSYSKHAMFVRDIADDELLNKLYSNKTCEIISRGNFTNPIDFDSLQEEARNLESAAREYQQNQKWVEMLAVLKRIRWISRGDLMKALEVDTWACPGEFEDIWEAFLRSVFDGLCALDEENLVKLCEYSKNNLGE
jgi:hypothetical protein